MTAILLMVKLYDEAGLLRVSSFGLRRNASPFSGEAFHTLSPGAHSCIPALRSRLPPSHTHSRDSRGPGCSWSGNPGRRTMASNEEADMEPTDGLTMDPTAHGAVRSDAGNLYRRALAKPASFQPQAHRQREQHRRPEDRQERARARTSDVPRCRGRPPRHARADCVPEARAPPPLRLVQTPPLSRRLAAHGIHQVELPGSRGLRDGGDDACSTSPIAAERPSRTWALS